MSDTVQSPSVKTELKQGDFTLVILAYRVLSQKEAMAVAVQWLRTQRKRSFPKSGTVTIYTTIGLCP